MKNPNETGLAQLIDIQSTNKWLDQFREALMQVQTAAEAKRAVTRIELATKYVRQLKLGVAVEMEVVETAIFTQFVLGQILKTAKDAGELDRGGRPPKKPLVNDEGFSLKEAGITWDESSQAQRLVEFVQKFDLDRLRGLIQERKVDQTLSRSGILASIELALKTQKKIEKKQRHAGVVAEPDYALQCCDLRKAKIEPESVDVILTDPPYEKEFLPCFEWLAQCAADWLKPGGSLLVMSGQHYLFLEVGKRLLSQPKLFYHWLVCYLTPGGQSVQIHSRKVNTFWKPILWLVKGKYQGDWIGDVTRSEVNANEKEFHQWGQSESGITDLMERFTLPEQLVVDPFCGGGTTGVVAVAMGRRFIGIDSDRTAIATTRARIEELL